MVRIRETTEVTWAEHAGFYEGELSGMKSWQTFFAPEFGG